MGIGIDLKGIGGIIEGLGKAAKDVRDAITGDIPAEKKAEIQLKLTELENQSMAAQNEVNKIEASSSSLFVAGWRPAVGWICAFGLFYGTIGKPFFEMIAVLFGYSGSFPTIDDETLKTTLWGMLGLGLFRTAEKIRGAAQNH